MPLKWNAEAYKRDLLQKLAKNGEEAGDFMETEARRRMFAVQGPAWWAGYRRLVASLVAHDVKIERNGVTVRVGVKRTRHSKRHGLYIELGRAQWPPSPFLSPAVHENAKKIVAILKG